MSTFQDEKEIKLASIESTESKLGDILDSGSWTDHALDAIDWLWESFGPVLGLPGTSLYEAAIKPIAGDFNRIKANGAAWEDAGNILGNVAHNMGENAAKLHDDYWGGQAGDAFYDHINVSWCGGIIIVSECCKQMKRGFEKLGDMSKKIAEKCIEIIKRIIAQAARLAAKIIPSGYALAGHAMRAVKRATQGKIPFLDDAKAIYNLVQEVLKLHRTITNLVNAAWAYFGAFHQAVDAVLQIKTVDSTGGAASMANQLKDATTQMKEARENWDQNKKFFDKQATAMGRAAG